ncbi:acetyltransferase family protein [Collimonas arenae]|uniref:Acetyltransferase family protein n=1 Tax=Collimonas arenae TaxID=279058 RepID=A0A127PU50_9BURK|nr:GNAT family protein [Collimonas arenae]AMP00902.1 acetyltransferase family protein [Collimonas arenae]AMP10795.1 acetyltransferase family protein [Collimonas arenae]
MTPYFRELGHSDLIQINRWRNTPETVAQLGSAFRFVGMAIDEKWMEHYLSSRSNNVRLAICDSTTQQLVGAMYLLNIDWLHRNAECAIWIGETEAQGKGIGQQAMRRLLAHAFDDLNLHRIYLSVLSNNIRALNLYKKIGFSEEGKSRDAIFKNGSYDDLIQMAILSNEYHDLGTI